MTEELSFYLFGAVALVGAVNTVLRRNPVHGALFLVCSFLGVAGLFLSMGSGLLAAIQVIVYAGAIMVLFLFVILLLNLEEEPFEGVSVARAASALAGVTTLALIVVPFLRAPTPDAAAPMDVPASVQNVGLALFRDYALPFEIVSLLLLVAMVGAIHLARRTRPAEVRSDG